MMTRTDRAELGAALADGIESMLGALARAENPSAEEWNPIIERVEQLYEDLGKHIKELDRPF